MVVALDGVDPERLPGALGISPYEARQCAKGGGYHLQRVAAAADAEAYRERLAAQGTAIPPALAALAGAHSGAA